MIHYMEDLEIMELFNHFFLQALRPCYYHAGHFVRLQHYSIISSNFLMTISAAFGIFLSAFDLACFADILCSLIFSSKSSFDLSLKSISFFSWDFLASDSDDAIIFEALDLASWIIDSFCFFAISIISSAFFSDSFISPSIRTSFGISCV